MIKKIYNSWSWSCWISNWNDVKSKGFNVEIYEMKNQVGGMCRSWRWNKFSWILVLIFFILKILNFGILEKIIQKNLIQGTYRAKNVTGKLYDRMIDYPLSLDAINQLPKDLKDKVKIELRNLKVDKKKSTNFKSHVINQVGPTLQSLFYEDYPEKVWGLKTNDMTSEWAPKRIIFTKKTIPFFNKEFTGV